MSSVRNWPLGLVITALVLLSPIVGFLMIITAEMLIDLLMEARAIVAFVVPAGAIGWALFRKISPRRKLTPLTADDEALGKPAISAPPI